MSVHFTDRPGRFGASAAEKFTRWYSHLLERGVYVAPSRFEAMFVSDAHTDADIERTCEIVRDFAELEN